jgi:hypothetical protein
MIRNITVITALLALSITACKKQEPQGKYWGEASAQLNGEVVSYDIHCRHVGPDFFSPLNRLVIFAVILENGYVEREILNFHLYDPITSTEYNMNTFAGARKQFTCYSAFNTTQADGDVPGHAYRLDTTKPHKFFLDRFQGGMVEASFHATYVFANDSAYLAAFPNIPRWLPDTLTFENGKIKTKVVEWY